MHPERPPVPDVLGRVGEHRVPGRVADALADPLGDDQHRGDLPAPGQREQRHDRHLQDVAADRDRPVLPGAVGAAAGEQPDVVAEELPGPADHADRERSGAEQPEIRAGDAAGSLVGEVGEEAHDPHHEHELQRRGAPPDRSDPLPGGHTSLPGSGQGPSAGRVPGPRFRVSPITRGSPIVPPAVPPGVPWAGGGGARLIRGVPPTVPAKAVPRAGRSEWPRSARTRSCCCGGRWWRSARGRARRAARRASRRAARARSTPGARAGADRMTTWRSWTKRRSRPSAGGQRGRAARLADLLPPDLRRIGPA